MVGDLLKVLDSLQELVHVCDSIVEDLVSRVLYRIKIG